MKLILFFFVFFICSLQAQPFVHPGILHSQDDLTRMKKAVVNKQEPIYSGYQVFLQNPVSQHTYKMQGPMAMVGRNPTVGQTTYDTDANAAYHNAIMWSITGDKAYADKTIEIINAWSSTLKSITGRDAVLMAGLGPFKMVNAAEIIRYSNADWSEADIRQAEKQFKEVIYPVIKDVAPFANGNWDAAAIKTMMAIGVFCNDRAVFERALRYYVKGHGNGCLTNYIINEEGQIQESGRDQGHTQLGIAMLAECSEIAWHQGLNLYAYHDNRLLKGFEYVAKFNLGYDVPFTYWLDRTGKYEHKEISFKDRGSLRAIYEQVYHHYVNRMGLTAPYTKQAAEKIRPEGPGHPGADNPGYGTFYFTKSSENAVTKAQLTVPAQPGAIIANGSAKGVSLTWIASTGTTAYTVKRAMWSGGPYAVIAEQVAQPSYFDNQVKSGTVYYYTVSATNAKGTSADAYETAVAAGLPIPWNQATIGQVSIQGNAAWNGTAFTIEGIGMGLDSLADSFHYIYLPLKDDVEISVRVVPQPSSQFSQFGLMIRENLAENAAHASLMIYPDKTAFIEAPDWQVRFISRPSAGAVSKVSGMPLVLDAPVVTYGRMTGECWLKLQKKGTEISGFISYDGNTWLPAGTVVFTGKKTMVGMAVSSGLSIRTTTISFDHFTFSPIGYKKLACDFDVDESLSYCAAQVTRSLAEMQPLDYTMMPRTIANNKKTWECRKVSKEEWCSGFWPGILWYEYEFSGDSAMLSEARNYTASLAYLSEMPAFDHDLGFLMFNSFGNGYRLTGDTTYKAILLRTADTLATLFNPNVGTLLSWPREVQQSGWPHNTIMDNMINLELLFWASKNGGDPSLAQLAVSHADKTMENQFRKDYSSYHVAVYDTVTGAFIKGVTHQGYSDNSMWARGQAWAIYGFTMVYRETRDKKYLDFVQKVADVYIENLPDDLVPYWDFNDPAIPNAPRDASAAAITASALLELSTLVDDPMLVQKYRKLAVQMLKSLSAANYRSGTAKPSFLLHATGHKPNGSEVDASIIYADYYFLEALTRYKRYDFSAIDQKMASWVDSIVHLPADNFPGARFHYT